MRRVDLLAVGEAFEDLVFIDLPHLPRPGEEIKTDLFQRTVGGGAVITALAAARLGIATRVVSALGSAAVDRLAQDGVAVDNLTRAGESHAITAALSTRADRAFVTYNGVNAVLEQRLMPAVRDANARHVHLAFYPRHCRRWIALVQRCRARGITTSWDFGWNRELLADDHFDTLARAVDLLFLNEREAPLYARRRSLPAAVRVWQQHPQQVVLKLGARGSRLLARGVDVAVPAPRVRPVDTTGAGDAFNGGFLFAWLRGAPARTCLRVGNFVGARSTRRPGGVDGLPTRDDLPSWGRARE